MSLGDSRPVTEGRSYVQASQFGGVSLSNMTNPPVVQHGISSRLEWEFEVGQALHEN